MTPVYYEEYEEVDHMVRTPSGGQVNEVLLVAFSVIACSMSSPELLQTTSSCVEVKSGAAVDVLSLLCTLFWCGINMWLNSLHFGLDCIIQCVFIFFGTNVLTNYWNRILQCLFIILRKSALQIVHLELAVVLLAVCYILGCCYSLFVFVLVCLGNIDLCCL